MSSLRVVKLPGILMYNDSQYFNANESVSTRTSESGAVLYNPDNMKQRFLNETGLFIWQRLDGTRKKNEIIKELMQDYDSDKIEEIESDVSDFINELTSKGFCNPVDAKNEIQRSIKNFISINDAPETIDVSVTGKCNLHCPYCFYSESMEKRSDLQTEEWLKFFDELGTIAVKDVVVSGGEAFVREDFWEIIDSLIKNRMRYSILTNGTLITEKEIDEFNQGKRRIRLDHVQVSIDGSSEETHDRIRGKGNFDKAIKGLKLLLEAGLPATVRVTMNQYNIDDIENIAALLLDEIGLSSFSSNDASPLGAGCENQKSVVLTSKQQLQAMKTLGKLEEKYNGRITSMAGPLAKFHCYKEMEDAKAEVRTDESGQKGYLTACNAVFSKLAVLHDGTIVPCNMLPTLELGKINEVLITEIWEKHEILKALRERRKIPMTEVEDCKGCEWTSYCNGSCPTVAYEMFGNLNRANLHDCFKRFLDEVGDEYRK